MSTNIETYTRIVEIAPPLPFSAHTQPIYCQAFGTHSSLIHSSYPSRIIEAYIHSPTARREERTTHLLLKALQKIQLGCTSDDSLRQQCHEITQRHLDSQCQSGIYEIHIDSLTNLSLTIDYSMKNHIIISIFEYRTAWNQTYEKQVCRTH